MRLQTLARRAATHAMLALLTLQAAPLAAQAVSGESSGSQLTVDPSLADQAAAAKQFPLGISLPWRTIGLDPATTGAARAELNLSANLIAHTWLKDPEPLTAALSGRPVPTINASRRLAAITAGKPLANVSDGNSLTLEPTWCSLMDRYVFMIAAADTATNQLLAAEHVTLPRQTWDDMDPAAHSEWLRSHMPELATQALRKATRREPVNALHVGLTVGANLTRIDEGSGLCVNQLVEAALAPDYMVARSVGADTLAAVRDVLGQSATLLRPTRLLVMAWQFPAPEIGTAKTAAAAKSSAGGKKPKPQNRHAELKRSLPVRLGLAVSAAESVFGHHLPLSYHGTWEFALGEGDRLNFPVAPALKKLLDDEAGSLVLNDWPRVAKVYRAWVYLDRGRAWGLKMNDRVLAAVDGKPVKGHVVRFFGPEANLVSPRGFPIREGAIVYLRKNQALPKVGTEFRMDPRSFPTPYPLTSSNAGAGAAH